MCSLSVALNWIFHQVIIQDSISNELRNGQPPTLILGSTLVPNFLTKDREALKIGVRTQDLSKVDLQENLNNTI